MMTFGDIKTSSALNIAGVSPKSDEFRKLLNDSVQRLMRRGDWEGTIVPIYTCINQGKCVVWPRYVGQIRQLNYCHRNHVPIQNVWWDFLPYSRHLGWRDHEWWGWMSGRASMVNQSRSPVFQDIQGDGRTIRAYPASASDVQKTITIFGTDNNGQRLMTQGAGPWSDGIKLTLQVPFVETPIFIRQIERVIKDQTTGPVRLYAFNSATSLLEDVAYYEPSETRPNYLRSRLSLPCFGTTDCSGNPSTANGIIALVKLQFIPVFADTDLVLIDNLVAIKHMMQSIRSEESQDTEGAREFLVMAIDELNQELADVNPETQIPVDLGELGHNQHSMGVQRLF